MHSARDWYTIIVKYKLTQDLTRFREITRRFPGETVSENEMFKQDLEVRRAVLGTEYVAGSLAKADVRGLRSRPTI